MANKKAYDLVDRNKLLNFLNNKGCSSKFLKAIGESITISYNIINSSVVTSCMGIRQGGPSSGSHFNCLMDHTMHKLNNLGWDSWLKYQVYIS